HAASVRSEPGSNSPVNILANHNRLDLSNSNQLLLGPLALLFSFQRSKIHRASCTRLSPLINHKQNLIAT
ncbi:hypothetical protein, partial [Desulfobulbus propionicus]